MHLVKKVIPILLTTVTIIIFTCVAEAIAYGTNNALSFDGNDDYVEINDDDSLDISDSFTIEAWINPSGFGVARGIITKWDTAANERSYVFGTTSTGRLHFAMSRYGTGVNLSWIGDNIIALGCWSHVAVTFDGTDYIMYINGTEDDSYNFPYSLHKGMASILLGNDPVNSVFNGTIDEIRIWNCTRSEQEIQDNMYIELSGNEVGLVAYWNLNEGTGQIANDLTANNNHGQLGSTPGNDNNDPTWVLSDAPITPPPPPPGVPAISLWGGLAAVFVLSLFMVYMVRRKQTVS